jgi:hypothetical protein
MSTLPDNLLSDITSFISSCRWAGPDGLDTLKSDAWKLYKRLIDERAQEAP